MEHKTWWKAITYPERIDYLSFQNNELVFVLAIEKLLELETPPKATWMRTLPLRAEPDPLAPRLARHRRARAGCDLDVLVLLPRARAGPRPLRAGRGRADAHAVLPGRRARRGHPARVLPRGRKFATGCRRRSTSTRALVDRNKIWLERTVGLGLLSADDAIALGQSGPVLRGSGVDWDLRKVEPYLAYAECDFRVPVYHEGDVYARYRVHMEEMRESMRIIAQCLDRLEEMEGEPWIADDRKVVLPPREELHTSMESLIHHFKIVTEGYRVPEGEIYVDRRVAARRARLLRRLRRRAAAVAREVPRAVVRRAAGDRDLHERRADRRHDRDRRLARHGHGRGRPVSWRAVRPHPGGARALSRGHALGDDPGAAARAGAVRLAPAGGDPRGRRRARPDARPTATRSRRSTTCSTSSRSASTWSRSARTSRARSTARSECVEAFEEELGCHAGETSDDGKVTLRTVECLGGCGYATSSRSTAATATHVKPEDVPGDRRGDARGALVGRSWPAPTSAT